MVRHKITTNRAMQIAEEARGLFSDETERVIRGRSVVATLAPVAVTKQSRARSAAGADTLMYIVNYSNDNGFVFVSNDDRDGEILMYSGNGNFAKVERTSYLSSIEYVHANLGWGSWSLYWVQRGVYDQWIDPKYKETMTKEQYESDYSGYLYYLPGITPPQN